MSKDINEVLLALFNVKLSPNSFEFISNFTLLWGIFENKFRQGEKSLNDERIIKVITSEQFTSIIKIDTFTNLPEFVFYESSDADFVITLPEMDFRVSLFPIIKSNQLKRLKIHFKDSNVIIKKNNPEIILLLCIISFRLRNNLFHGNKNFAKLHKQEKLFGIINKFLSEILINTKNVEFN